MITFNFYSAKEKMPTAGQNIIYMKHGGSFASEWFEPRQCSVEAQWIQLEDGEYTGNSEFYDVDDPTPSESFEQDGVVVTYRLMLTADGYEIDDNFLWTPLEEYWAAFDKHFVKTLCKNTLKEKNDGC